MVVLRNGGKLGHPDGWCFYCGRAAWAWKYQSGVNPPNDTLTADHVIPKSHGGTQLVPSCRGCNLDKKNLTLDEFRVVRAFRAGLLPVPDYKFTAEQRV